jgi:hypothetical protein
MNENFQRLFMMAEPEILPLNAQAARGVPHAPERSQFAHLCRLFLERFFNHETASPDGDAKTRMVQIAFAAGLPGFAVALYLFPIYHPFPWPLRPHILDRPPYWLQVNHHFFFIVYAFVSMGMATVFEWDMFFPDLLDVLILGPLPIAPLRIFLARIAAIAVFIGGFLLDANFLAPLVLPASTDPPNLTRFLAGHLAAVALSGLFAAVFILAAQSVLLALLGERHFRRVSLALQGSAIAVLLLALLLFPIFSRVVPALLESKNIFTFLFPPFWFLGIDQRLLEGPAALPVFGQLAKIGCAATVVSVLATVVFYPIAYARKVRALIEGTAAKSTRNPLAVPLNKALHATLLRAPSQRAVFHFVTQTILRVARYRIYLVLYGGAGLAVLAATLLRFTVAQHRVHLAISSDGVRAAAAIVAFWTVAGLRMAFVSPGNQRGAWVFHVVQGNPANFHTAIDFLKGAKLWVQLAASAVTASALVALHAIAPPELKTWTSIAAQCLVAGGMCLLIADVFFLHVTSIAFTGESTQGHSNLALTVLKYYAFFPFVAWVPAFTEPWIEMSAWHFAWSIAAIASVHLLLQFWHRGILRDRCSLPGPEEELGGSFLSLGLRQ